MGVLLVGDLVRGGVAFAAGSFYNPEGGRTKRS